MIRREASNGVLNDAGDGKREVEVENALPPSAPWEPEMDSDLSSSAAEIVGDGYSRGANL